MSKAKPKPYPTDLLLDQCIQRDERAIEKLYRLCFSYLMHVCFKFYTDQSQSESMVNQGFMRILVNLQKYERGRSFSNWIHQIMLRILIDEERKNKKWNERVHILEDTTLEEKVRSRQYNAGEEKLLQTDVLRLLNVLSEKEKLIFSLYAIEEWKHAEISKELDIKESLSKWYVHQARKKLQAELEKQMTNEKTMKWTK